MDTREIELKLEHMNWQRLLTALCNERLVNLAEEISAPWQVEHVALPQVGLGMLQLVDGAFEQPFYLGEFPVATCQLQLTLPTGEKIKGAAQVMSDDQSQAQALAIFDAVIRHNLEGIEAVMSLVQEGQIQCDAEDHERRAMLMATRVEFSELSEAGDDDED